MGTVWKYGWVGDTFFEAPSNVEVIVEAIW